jgi:hypothetical protein
MPVNSSSTKSSSQQIHTPGLAEIQSIFEHRNPKLSTSDLTPLARLVANFADVVAGLAVDQRKRIPTSKKLLRSALLKASSAEIGAETSDTTSEPVVEQHVGTGLGELLNLNEGRARMTAFVQKRPLESWAGPVAGPGEIEKQLHVPRSTLNEWHRRGAVIGLLRGERKHVYPLDQFLDARPVQGVGDVAKIAPDERAAWLWLRQPHGRFDMRTPLELLKMGQRDEVVQAAEGDFG